MMETDKMEITIYGLVQGVGFRPFVAEQAEALGIAGTVRNVGGIVKISAEGKKEALDEFVHRLSACVPKGARVDNVEILKILKENSLTVEKDTEKFFIINSEPAKDALRFLPSDIATCEFCRRELLDPKNRRYRYPFISCTSCGPRFSIMQGIPYDRDTITMKEFPMCQECAKEYWEKGNKRRHAQTIACAECGPQVRLYEYSANGQRFHGEDVRRRGTECIQEENITENSMRDLYGEDAVWKSIELLKQGKILAIKDIGGFHFAFDPEKREPAKRLRIFKGRERKPFAVMFPELSDIRKYCEVSETEEKLLCSVARPIVLLKKKEGMDFVHEVCGESSFIGAMLPCNPLQILLLQETGPLVMTSGNRGGEPIITDEKKVFEFWKNSICSQDAFFGEKPLEKRNMRRGFLDSRGQEDDGEKKEHGMVPDAILTHNRRILYGLDDSIFQVTVCGKREVIQVIRRARGFVPEPVRLSGKLPFDTFAAGGDLKAVFALGRENMAYLSAHFGDLEDARAKEKREEALEGMCALLGIFPEHAVCDKHPRYVSVKDLTEDLRYATDSKIKKIQHHHAHIAAVMAEYDLKGAVLGVAYDGTGYGDDGTVWGGEFLLCEGKEFRRAGHLESVLMTGGEAALKNARITAYCYFFAAKAKGYLTQEEFEENIYDMDHSDESENFNEREVSDKLSAHGMILDAALKNHINTYDSSSMGRLFDAAAAVLGICMENSYEGECPEKLQTYAERYLEKNYEECALSKDVKYEKNIAKFGREVHIPIYKQDAVWIADGAFLIAELAKERKKGASKEKLAYEFHRSIAEMTIKMCEKICYEGFGEIYGETNSEKGEAQNKKTHQIALGGGTMYNRLLLKLMIPAFENKGYEVYVDEKVPSGDGGLAYGQLALESVYT